MPWSINEALSVVKWIIETHGGRIWIDSEVGKGEVERGHSPGIFRLTSVVLPLLRKATIASRYTSVADI